MSSMLQPVLSPALLSVGKEALTCFMIGTVVATGVYGITILQAYIYFQNSGKHATCMKSLVAILFVLDTLSLVLNVQGFCKFVISDFGNSLLLLEVPLTLALENGATVLIGTLTQCFFVYRLWALSKGNILLVGAIIILAACSCSLGLVISVNLYKHRNIFYLGSLETRILAGFANGLSVVCDILIAAALSYYLHSKRTGFKRTDSIINRLIIYAVNRGALTAICQACHAITIVALPGRFVFLPFALLDGKLYCNTLLATLNAQKSIVGTDRQNAAELGIYVLEPMNTSSSRRGKHRGNGSGRSVAVTSSDSMPTLLPAEKTVEDSTQTSTSRR